MKDSAEKGERYCIEGVEPGNAYNSMQQRIRAQAKKLNYKVIIRYDRDNGALYFKATRINSHKEAVQNVDSITFEEDVTMTAAKAGAKTSSKKNVSA